ncbi:Lead, cadmium, zinc and mercury transporting ATPase [Caldibacillus thermoamylovorans]|uniref:Lead, cadmium, zinc and mercury transporting ATPase n=2 Tax=Caldibacillus thermoamylovorans TaxID=35841 RepID=A0ABD4ABL4_9BACI|nr:Lead, cadmium, zinc and mercury transporting ATPase [Caldibacillus thermoamylovorans]KIO69980.1 Lead, cadmium, zinc and mercury transporting ATPase [Caldibacillus thermoamylovorans]KIO74444.1 Lead, cadmium, zinc and mercury transporting ATPase [Caldibacillus thermoamylovorans]
MELNISLRKKLMKENQLLKEKLLRIEPYIELGFALFSGILILTGWILAKLDQQAVSVFFYILAYVIGGYFKAKEGITDTIHNKTLNVELLMVLAALGSAIIGYWEEGAILIFIFALSGALETYTMSKSRKEISALMSLQPEEAWLIKDGKEVKVAVEKLQVGDHIFVKPGERIPADGCVIKGRTSVDQAAITGESIPVGKGLNDDVFAGTVNISGSITVEITKPSSETLFQKIITLVQNAESQKSPSQQFIDRCEGTYVKLVLAIVSLMLFLPHYIFGWSWNETFYRAMVLLVVASPCAVVASIMPATLSAISNGARKGILFKGGSHLESLGNLRAIAFDKTGTLTQGKPEVSQYLVKPDLEDEKQKILQIVAAIEKHSNHPLAQAIVRFATTKNQNVPFELDSIEDVSGWGVKAFFNGEIWKIGKRAFMDGNIEEVIDEKQRSFLEEQGNTIVYIEKDQQVVAAFALKDIVREESKQAITNLQALGIEPIMLTGDNANTAKAIASEVGINQYIYECLPENKVNEIRAIKEKYGLTAMVGDGINDAPALATADIGMAMGEGTDAALETADVVLMKNDLTKISQAIHLSKRMNRIIKQNLVFSISVIILLVMSNFFQSIDLPLGVIGHEGSTILVILNGLRLLK